MKRLLQLGFILGFGGTLAAAYFAPWFEYTRYRSAAQVVANGGRVEQFIVQLPADRLETRSEVSLGADLGVRLQHFKLRDTEGNVIGLAAKHELAGSEAAWLLTIPSRGTIVLAGAAAETASLESIVAANGLGPGDNADQPLSIDIGEPLSSVSATGEFAEIEFDLVETWVVSGLDDEGEIRGTLQLNTIGRLST